jgi:hypothetical protein
MSNEAPSELIEDERVIGMIVEAAAAIDAADFERLSVGDDVSELSSNTIFDSLEVVPEGILKAQSDGFEASATVYITLNYGGSRDSVSMPDSYPAVVRGVLNNDGAGITEVDVDTGSFYE